MIDSPDEVPVFENAETTNIKRLSTEEQCNLNAQNIIRGYGLTSYYIRLSYNHKIQFFNSLINNITTLSTMALILNTLHSINGKVTSYCLSSKSTPINFDRMITEHDRMLDSQALSSTIKSDLEWFGKMENKDQVAYIITLLRYSGGAMAQIVYKQLQLAYNQRLQKKLSSPSEEKVKRHSSGTCTMNNLSDPQYQKVLQLEKTWNDIIETMQSDLDKTTTKKKIKAEVKKPKDDCIQIMPIWIVKKIFSYLDTKSLKKAEKVDPYWKWAIKELQKDKKVMKAFRGFKKKLKQSDVGLATEPIKPKKCIGHLEKRRRKLNQRGAILEDLRMVDLVASDSYGILLEGLKQSESAPYADNFTMFPRVTRKRETITTPFYTIKDYKIIATDDVSDSDDLLTQFSSQNSINTE